MNKQTILFFVLVIFAWASVNAQTITVNADSYKHQFEGAGVSIGLYLGHHYSMSEANQDKAIQLVARDCNMKYLQDYIQIYPDDDPPYFDRRANYIKAAKTYQPEIKVSMVGNKFPADLMHEIIYNGEKYSVLNTDDPLIYDKLANWYFELFKGFFVRDVPVEILNVVNEPDLDRVFRKQHYGLNGNTKEAVAQIFEKAVPKLKAMLNDPVINTLNMPVPLIMGPSTISPNGCLDYVNFFKTEHPDAWNQIDIVSTHQYENGSIDLTFKNIVNEIEGKPFHQSETHAFMGDNLGSLPVDKPLRTVLSLSSLFGTAVTNGVSAWYYFENNYPDEFHPGGLLQVAWATNNPIPYKHYYAFKQLTSAQPAFSHVVEHEAVNAANSEITTFRKKGEDTVYVHYSNYTSYTRNVTIKVSEMARMRKISSFSLRVTDGFYNDDNLINQDYDLPVDEITFAAGIYSVNTVKIALASDSPVGISKGLKNEPEIKIFDVGEYVKIKSVFTDPLADVKVFSLTGRLVVHEANLNNEEYLIAKNEHKSGIYIVRISTMKYVVSKKIFL